MALASATFVPTEPVRTTATVKTVDHASVRWNSVGTAGVSSLVFAVLLTAMLAVPLTQLSTSGGVSVAATGLVATVVAPLVYLLFTLGAWSAVRDELSDAFAIATLQSLAFGLVPWVGLVGVALAWQSGPSRVLLIAAAVSVPTAMVVAMVRSGVGIGSSFG